ncbi:MAG: hypothetical protein R3C49_17190 [Planctomycetaceae bacterium]
MIVTVVSVVVAGMAVTDFAAECLPVDLDDQFRLSSLFVQVSGELFVFETNRDDFPDSSPSAGFAARVYCSG